MDEITIKVWRTEQDGGGYMYSIHDSQNPNEDDDGIEGGHCTGSLLKALQQAEDTARELIAKRTGIITLDTTAKLEPMRSPRSGRPVANQWTIDVYGGTFFQSYRSIIAFKGWDGTVVLDEYYWDYSTTTAKYRREFLGEGIEETRRKLEMGEYKFANLNGSERPEIHSAICRHCGRYHENALCDGGMA